MTQILAIVVLLVVVAILVWGGDALMKLAPPSKLIQAARIIAIVAISIWVVCLIAAFFGVATPWVPGYVGTVHHRG
jgi:hypothetical protein